MRKSVRTARCVVVTAVRTCQRPATRHNAPSTAVCLLSLVACVWAPASASDHQTALKEAGRPIVRAYIRASGDTIAEASEVPAFHARLRKLVDQVAAKTRLPSSADWDVVIYKPATPSGNAYVVCGCSGVIAVANRFSSLSDGELRLAIAHEMSHYLNGDCGPDPRFCVDENVVYGQIVAAMEAGASTPDRAEIEAQIALDRWAERAADTGAVYLANALGESIDYSWLLKLQPSGRWLTRKTGAEDTWTLSGLSKALCRFEWFRQELRSELGHGTGKERQEWLKRAEADAAGSRRLPAPDLGGVDKDLAVCTPMRSRLQLGGDVGWPVANGSPIFVHGWGGGRVQDVRTAAGEMGCIMLKDGETQAYWVHGAIWATYASGGGPAEYGYPTGEEYDVPTGRAQRFEHRTLVWNRSTGVTTAGGASITEHDGHTGFPGTGGGKSAPEGVPVDLIFCIDATGSMADDIDEVKAHAAELITTTRAKCPDLRLGLVTYRDFSVDGARHLETALPLTADYASVESAIQGITVSGGGDESEDVLDGLKAALDMDWREGVVKLVTLLGDAPAKDPDHAGNTTASICKYAEELDPVHVYPLTCGSVREGDATWGSFTAIAEGTGATVYRVDEVGELTDTLMQTIAKAIEKHKSEAVGGWSVGGGGGGDDDGVLGGLLLVGTVVVVLLFAVVVQRRRSEPIAEPPEPRGTSRWTVRATGPFGRRAWSVSDRSPFTIGRGRESIVVLDDPQVSAAHATLYPSAGGWLLVDAGSRNGTYVDGKQVRRMGLRGGETIRIGSSQLVLQRDAQTDE